MYKFYLSLIKLNVQFEKKKASKDVVWRLYN